MIKYYYTDGVNKYGPFSKDELRNQKISRSTKVWFYGIENWTELSNLPELSDLISSIPPDIKPINTFKKKHEIRSDLNFTKTKEQLSNKKRKPLRKWLVVLVLFLIISIPLYLFIRHQVKRNLYNEIVSNSYGTSEHFEMYVEKFYRDAEYYGLFPKKPKRTIIKFAKLDQLDNTTHIHGISFGIYNDDEIEIYINPSTWKNFNKPMRYYLMYHELAHDVLNVDDLDNSPTNKGKLMYPEIASYESITMDDFIESSHELFKKMQ